MNQVFQMGSILHSNGLLQVRAWLFIWRPKNTKSIKKGQSFKPPFYFPHAHWNVCEEKEIRGKVFHCSPIIHDDPNVTGLWVVAIPNIDALVPASYNQHSHCTCILFILLSPFISDLAWNYWFEILMLLFLFSAIKIIISNLHFYHLQSQIWRRKTIVLKRFPLNEMQCLSIIQCPMLVKVKISFRTNKVSI